MFRQLYQVAEAVEESAARGAAGSSWPAGETQRSAHQLYRRPTVVAEVEDLSILAGQPNFDQHHGGVVDGLVRELRPGPPVLQVEAEGEAGRAQHTQTAACVAGVTRGLRPHACAAG